MSVSTGVKVPNTICMSENVSPKEAMMMATPLACKSHWYFLAKLMEIENADLSIELSDI